jgi:hypothetical protein
MTIEPKNTHTPGTPEGRGPTVGGKQTFLGVEVANLIQRITNLIDRGEYQRNPYDFIEARRLLNNVLPKAVDIWVATERQEAFVLGVVTSANVDRGGELFNQSSSHETSGSSE